MKSKFATLVLLRHILGEEATGSLGTREEDQNIKKNQLFVNFGIEIIFKFILVSGTPGFAGQYQLGGYGDTKNDYFLFLFCDWKTIWSMKYRPIDENQREEIDKIVKVRKYCYL